jgi:energy-coupling factor transporter transmembrane protein EcfT
MSPGTRRSEALAPLLLGAMAGALVAGGLESAIACLAIAAVLAGMAGAAWPRPAWWRLLAGGGVISIGLNLYLNPGRALPLPVVLGQHASREGLRLGCVLGLRVLGAAVALHGLRALWPGERAADEVARRLMPLERVGLPVRRGRMVIGLALRFAPHVGAEARRIARVQALRAGRPARGLGERLRRARAAMVPTMVGALERAERTALALEARHYRMRPVAPAGHRGWGWGTLGLALAGAALLWRR